MKKFAGLFLLLAVPILAQNPAAPSHAEDTFKSLRFLEGSWTATAQGNGGAAASGSYSFKLELGEHVLARHSHTDAACKGPATFDCEHGDLLYVFADAPGQPLKAIYFDNEGHVIHYDVSTPTPTTAMFVSEASQPGPRFRLVYELKGAVMSGRFQMQMPGATEWNSYLEWSGSKQ
jgi:hypothetical protein